MALLLFEQIASLFLLILSGYILVRLQILKSSDSRVLSMFCIYLATPAVIISSFQIELTDAVRDGFLLDLGIAILIHVLYILADLLYAKLFHLDGVERGSALYANCGNLIIPLITSLLGPEYLIYTSAYLCVQLFFIWTHGQALVSGTHGTNWRKILGNCNLISIILGLLLMLLHIQLPDIVTGALDSLGSLLGPLSMLMVGMLLADTDLRAMLRERNLYIICALRLIVNPILVLILLRLSGLTQLLPDGNMTVYVTFLASCAPAASLITQLAQLHQHRPAYAGGINIISTLLCIATMPFMTSLYSAILGPF